MMLPGVAMIYYVSDGFNNIYEMAFNEEFFNYFFYACIEYVDGGEDYGMTNND